MTYRFLADSTLVLHLIFILFVLFGGFLCIKKLRWLWFHLPALIWGIWVEWHGLVCPLTPLENHFRRLASEEGYQGGFIEHYLLPLVYPGNLTSNIQKGMGFAVITINLAIYLFVFYRRQKSPEIVDE